VAFYLDYSPSGHTDQNNAAQRNIVYGHQLAVDLKDGGCSKFQLSAVARRFNSLNFFGAFNDDPAAINTSFTLFDQLVSYYQESTALLNVGAALQYHLDNPTLDAVVPPNVLPIIVIIATKLIDDTPAAITAANAFRQKGFRVLLIAFSRAVQVASAGIADDADSVFVLTNNVNDTLTFIKDKSCQAIGNSVTFVCQRPG